MFEGFSGRKNERINLRSKFYKMTLVSGPFTIDERWVSKFVDTTEFVL